MQQTLDQARGAMGRILAVSQKLDATRLKLTAAEGYLLSRIDGATPWRLLREMGGIPAEEVDACLIRWVEAGVLEVAEGQTDSSSGENPAGRAQDEARESTGQDVDAACRTTTQPFVFEIDESQLDESLEIGLEVQRRILAFEAALGLPYQEILGVAKGAEPKVVKRAYFKLSKEFHPDRYFRREVGGYGARLERIFKKVLEAHEMLSDPELCQIENHSGSSGAAASPKMDSVETPPLVSSTEERPERKKKKAAPRPLTKLERLRQRMPFKIDPASIAERRGKADEIFRAACTSQKAGRFQEAESSIRIAISFDPMRTEFKEALGALRLESAGARAEKLLAAPSDRMSDSDLREALTLLEDVLIYRPHDPKLNERAARVCLQLGKFDAAVDFAQTLIERCPEVAEHHALLGIIYRGSQKMDAAASEFEMALKYDSSNLEARRALAAIRIGHHDAVHGGGS